MGLETGTYLNDLVSTNPLATDAGSQGDDHLRLLKATLQATLPGMAGRLGRIQNKAAGYSLAATDNLTVLRCTATLTIAGLAAATAGNGFTVDVFADGGTVTFDPSGSELVNGAATLTIANGAWATLVCDATGWKAHTFSTAADVATVAGIAANVTTVAGISANVTTLAGISADVTTVAGANANVAAVATDIANVNAVGADLLEPTSEINTVAVDIANVNTVATAIANVNTVAGISANVTTVAGISANVTTVAGISGNVTTVAGISADVTAVAGVSADVSAVAAQFIGWNFSTTTTMADPGSGIMRFNDATLASVTAIAFDDLNSAAADVSAYVLTWDDSSSTIKGTITVRQGTANFAIFNVTGLTDNAGWTQVAVTHVSSSGTFSNAVLTFVDFDRSGDAGTGDASTANPLDQFAASTTAVIGVGSINIGHASDTTLTRVSAGVVAIEGNTVYAAGGTDVAVADGGTGASTLTLNNVILGNGTSAVQFVAPSTSGNVLTSNGTTWTSAAPAGGGVGDHEVVVTTGNGAGSTNTAIRRFTTTETDVGADITYADSATDGATFTINAAGIYAIDYLDAYTTGDPNAPFGISLNSNQLTTGIESITSTHRLAIANTITSSNIQSCSAVVSLAVNDIIRAHKRPGAGAMVTTVYKTKFRIRKVGLV